MKKRIILKRGIAYLLAVAMVVGLMVCTPSDMMNVQAADGTSTTTGKTITGLGTEAIADPVVPTSTSDAWKGSYVYFGTYDTDGDNTAEPVKYRVLDSNTTVFGGTTMLLDCDSILWAGTNPSSVFDADSNVWADSDIRTYLNGTFLTGNFSMAEQSAIASSTKSAADSSDGAGHTYLSYASLSGEKIFFLDAKEATNTSYGYSNTNSSATNRIKTGGNAYWWLRSARTDDSYYAGIVYSDGYTSYFSVSSTYVGVSPALNVNLSSVLFTSVISGTAGETGAEYKLTLLDSDMTIAGNGTVTRNGDTVTIPYTISGTNSANATQVSVLLLDKEYTQGNTNDAEVIYYGALDTSVGNGTGTFTMPSELLTKSCGSDYYAYIVAEDVNGIYETDYASEPVSITIPWEAPTVNTINIGTAQIINPAVPSSTSDAWTGSYVYFGTYNGSPVKYRVLDSKTTVFGGTTMLLDCDSVLWAGSDPSSAFDADSNVWADSDIRTYLNGTFLTGNFSMAEQSAIASSTKSGADGADGDGWSSLNYAELNNDKIFFLDAKEATNESYGYSNTDYDATNRVKTGGNAYWWLRSASTNYSDFAGYVYSVGNIYYGGVDDDYIGVSPALNLNLSSVLFTSASGTSKSSALTAHSSQIGTTTGTEWKLTLQDTGKTIKITDNEKVIRVADGTITVPYTYTDTATSDSEKVNQISVMITDKEYTESDAEILYYGALSNIKDADGNIATVSNATSGTGTFALPSSLTGTLGTDYNVYILAEHLNTTNATDYASAPVEITSICDEVSSVAITDIDTPSSGNALDTTATVASNATASVKWYLGDTEVTGNAGFNKVYTVKVTLTADSDYAFTKDTSVTLNGNDVTATKNEDGTLTVSHTFDATGKGTINYTSTGYEGTYDGQAHGITVTVSDPTYVTITYSTDEGDNKTYSDTNPTFTDAGEYTVYYKIEKNDYTTVTGSQTVNIAKREITITADDQSITWGSNISRTAYTITSGSLVDGEIILTLIPSTLDLTTDGTILVGSVRIKKYTASSAEDLTDNYTVTKVSGKLTIIHDTSLPPTEITATKSTISYIAGQTLNVDDLTVTAYYADGYSEAVTDYTTNADSIDMNTAGDKTLTVSYTKNGGTVTKDITITVSLDTFVVTDADYTGTYDGQAHGITVNVSNVNDATITYSTDGATYSTTNPAFIDVGTYTVYYKVVKNGYSTVTDEAVVTITAKELAITADNQTITEGESIDNSKYTVSGLVSGDTLSTVTLTQSTTEVTDNGTIEASGAKIVNADGKDVTANYNITYTAGKLVVNEVEGDLQPDESDEYEITDGADSEWTVDSDVSITITGNGDFAKFVGVKVDGKLIDEANYTAKSDPTIVTLKSSYLNTLSVGEHTFEIVWSDGSASTTFTVKQAEDDKVPVIPNTGDNSSLGLWFVLLIGSGLMAVVLWKKKKYIVEE